MQDFYRMLTSTVKILILLTIYAATFFTVQSFTDAAKVESRCPVGSLPKPLPHETDCSLYYVCLHGKAIVRKCPSNLHFNKHSSVCDHPQNANCQKDSEDKVGREVAETNDQCPSENPDQPVLLPYKKDCGKFYICDAGVPLLKSCQPGLHFNPALSICDYPEKAGCDPGVYKKGRDGKDGIDIACPLNKDGNPMLTPHETDCGKFYTCSNGITLVHVCQHGLHFNAKLQQCDYPEKAGCEKGVNKKGRDGRDGIDYACPLNKDGNPMLRPHETDCGKFYTCNNGITLVQVCQHGLHFNAALQQCDYPEKAGCEKGVTKVPKGKVGNEIPEDQCPVGKNGKLMPHETDCTKFYMCDEGFPRLLTCQSGLHFNSKLQACDYPENAGCETVVSKKGRDGRDGIDFACPLNKDGNPILRPHETDCRKFYTCNNGITLVQVCQHGLHFNAALQQCDYPEKAGCEKDVPKKEPKGKTVWDDSSNVCSSVPEKKTVLLPHPDCSKFLICNSGVPHQKSCPSGLHFSTRLQACDYPSNVQCEKMGIIRSVGVDSPFCPELSGRIPIFYRHPSNCSIYYLCNHGLAYEFACPARLHFSLRLKRCDYEDVAMCSTGTSRKND